MSATDLAATPSVVPALRRLYLVRFGFAIVWAALFAVTSDPFGKAALVLAVVYPAFDLAAAVVDARSASAAGRPTSILYVNMALSLAAAIALAVNGTGDVTGVLRIWGAWAITAGAVQLVVGLVRRSLGGQWPMILSGGISVLAGASFVASAADADSVTNVAGYAVLGGIFFLVSALRLGRGARRVPAEVN